MISTNEHINFINDTIGSKVSLEKLKSIKIYGNAESILDINEGKPKKVPAVQVGTDFETMVYDDKYNLMIYHRIRSSQVIPNSREKGYGNEENSESSIRQSQLSAIVFLNRSVLDVSQEDLANSIMVIFPSSIPKAKLTPGISSVKYSILGFDYDTISIFRREYDGLEYDLKNQVVMIEVKYKIECSYIKGCVNNCLN